MRGAAGPDASDSRRIAYVDGLRAIAVLSVVAYHTAMIVPGLPNSPHYMWDHGAHGVDLFFVISGFCLSYPTLVRLHSRGTATFDVARYAARRMVRIIPPFYAAITLFLALALILGRLGVPLPASMPQHGFSAADVLKQFMFVDFRPNNLNGSFWTLFVEFRWYFIFPALLWVWTRSPKAFGLLWIGVLFTVLTRAASLDLLVLPLFMAGIVAADLHVQRRPIARYALPLFVVCFFYTMSVKETQIPGLIYVGRLPWVVTVFFFVVAAGQVPLLMRILSSRWLSAVGIASYSIYLVHEPLISFAEEHGVAAPIAGVIGLACGFAFWWIAERPFVETRLRDRLIAELEAFLPRWFKVAGIGYSMPLESTSSSAMQPDHTRQPAARSTSAA